MNVRFVSAIFYRWRVNEDGGGEGMDIERRETWLDWALNTENGAAERGME